MVAAGLAFDADWNIVSDETKIGVWEKHFYSLYLSAARWWKLFGGERWNWCIKTLICYVVFCF